MQNIKPVIMAGGYGKRLWPISKKSCPKQYLKIFSNKSLFQLTLERNQFLGKASVIIAEEHYIIASEQINSCGIEADIIIEPVSRNTAPCAIIASLIAEKESKDTVILLPADHYIENQDAYIASIMKAIRLGSRGDIVTLGLSPKIPHTGYGYIKTGKSVEDNFYYVEKFTEKPDLTEALEYISQGGYYWNSGIFIFAPKFMKSLAESIEPSMYRLSLTAFNNMKSLDNRMILEYSAYNAIEADSIDYAFMQKTSNIMMLKADFKWKDMGSWDAIIDLCEKDSVGNIIYGDAEIYDTHNSYIHSEGRITAVIGLNDLIIVNTKEASLIIHKSRANDIKLIMDNLLCKEPKKITN